MIELDQRVNKRWLYTIFLFVFVASCQFDNTDYKSKIVVKVNDSSLTAEQFSDQLIARLKSFNHISAKDSSVITQAKSAIVQDFIIQVVTANWAKEKDIFVRKEQLDEEVQKIKKNYPDEISFRKSLADNKLTYDEWLAKMKDTVLERLVINEIKKTIPAPTNDEIKAFYTKNKMMFQQSAAVKTRQIVVDSESTAQNIRKMVSQKQSFAELAKKYSISPEASVGGDIGWIERGYNNVYDGVFRLNAGQISQPIKSPQGFHLLEAVEKRVAKTLTLEEAKKKIEQILLAEKEQTIYSQWLEQQVLKTKVYKDDELLQHIQVFNRGGS